MLTGRIGCGIEIGTGSRPPIVRDLQGGVPQGTYSPAPEAAWVKDGCVDTGITDEGGLGLGPQQAVTCDSQYAEAKIVDIVDGGERTARTECPIDTDGFLDRPTGETACLRNLAGPHAGDPGKGGGILRVGDCIYAPDDGRAPPTERECYDRDGPGKIRSFAKKKAQCRDGDTATRRAAPTPVICHGAGAAAVRLGPVAETGACVKKPAALSLPGLGTSVRTPAQVACSDKTAWARVLGAARGKDRCPSATDYTLTSSLSYPSTSCLRRL
ncbi:hypothetical protein [Acrocarpospora sp. B8E8]|uniref:hypothetical protein n=1 Tax=Acrocarpospora sp. B8E8 TaxID=3153572 RepID=UPI00325DFDB3